MVKQYLYEHHLILQTSHIHHFKLYGVEYLEREYFKDPNIKLQKILKIKENSRYLINFFQFVTLFYCFDIFIFFL